eukprot:gene10063-10218_t
MVALAAVAAAALAGAVVWWRRRKNRSNVLDGPIDEEDAKFEAEIAAMEAEEKRLAAKKERALAAALAQGDAEMARIDALGSEDFGDLGSEELAALEAELAELENLDADD